MPQELNANKTKERAKVVFQEKHLRHPYEYDFELNHTNKSCSSKYRILEIMEKDCPELVYMNLLRLCHKNRFTPDEITDADVATMKEEYRSVFCNKPKTW